MDGKANGLAARNYHMCHSSEQIHCSRAPLKLVHAVLPSAVSHSMQALHASIFTCDTPSICLLDRTP